MKTKYGMLLVGALMTGCLPQTLFPLYSEETLTFEPLLLGVWEEGDEERWTFSAADPQFFHLQIRDDEGLPSVAGTGLVGRCSTRPATRDGCRSGRDRVRKDERWSRGLADSAR